MTRLKTPKMGNIAQKWVDLLIPFSNNYYTISKGK